MSARQLDLINDTALAADYPPQRPQTLFFPVPPSVNALWRMLKPGERGKVKKKVDRVPTESYEAWASFARWVIHAQRDLWTMTHGPVALEFLFERRSLLSDIDNRLKAAIDALVKNGVIDDDRGVVAVAVTWSSEGAVKRLAAKRGMPVSVYEGLRASKDGAGMVRVVPVLPGSTNTFTFLASPDAKSGAWAAEEPPHGTNPG
jgi:Holliday junction resolvase RusA-like endonuclease